MLNWRDRVVEYECHARCWYLSAELDDETNMMKGRSNIDARRSKMSSSPRVFRNIGFYFGTHIVFVINNNFIWIIISIYRVYRRITYAADVKGPIKSVLSTTVWYCTPHPKYPQTWSFQDKIVKQVHLKGHAVISAWC